MIRLLTHDGREIECEVTGPLELDLLATESRPVRTSSAIERGRRVRFVVNQKCVAFRPEVLRILEEAENWRIYDLNICGRSQFCRSGDDAVDALPGELFAVDAVDTFVAFETIQTAMPFWIDVAYVGPAPSARFLLEVRGMAAF